MMIAVHFTHLHRLKYPPRTWGELFKYNHEGAEVSEFLCQNFACHHQNRSQGAGLGHLENKSLQMTGNSNPRAASVS